MLQCLGCILPFLDKDLIDNIPYLAASSISVLPSVLHQDIINSMCFYILPFTITRQSMYEDQECHSCQSVSAVIMLVFQYSDNPGRIIYIIFLLYLIIFCRPNFSPSLSTAGMSYGAEAQCGQRFAVCYRLWNGCLPIVGGQTAVLLLARV